jgi:cyclomaltodextrinase / maltogenic alpha-amylase / neopullulanase
VDGSDGRRRRAAAAAVVVPLWLVSCTGGTPGDGPKEGRVIAFDMRGGDAWAWTERVAGTADCDGVRLRVNDAEPAEVAVDGGRFSATVDLVPGENRVVATCPGGARAEIAFTERLDARPTARIRTSLRGGVVTFDAGASEPGAFDGAPLKDLAWAERPGNPARLELDRTSGGRTTAQAPSTDGEYYVTLTVTDVRGRIDRSTTYFVVEHGTSRLPDMAVENPAWVDAAIVYGVVPALYGDEGFRSVAAKIPYLAELGANAIWLSPVNVSPPGDFGYAVQDYFDLNPDYGTTDDFRHLVETAHAHGIRVLMDFVPNHVSDEHPYSVDAATYGEASRYHDFFDRDEQGHITHYFDWSNLDNLNYDNPEVRRMVTEAFAYWVREFDVDGFRVDAAWGVEQRRPDFWPGWREELKRIKPDLLLLAEATARDPYYFSNGFDAGYDWTEDLGRWAWQGAFDAPEIIDEWLDGALLNAPKGYDPDALIFRFLNNNDTGTRFADAYGIDLARPAAALLLTLPGIPEIYTGEEVAASYLPYSALTPLDWKDPHDLRPYYRTLIELRLATPALRSRDWARVETRPGGSIYAYVRTATGAAPVLVVLNFADATGVEVPLDGPLAAFAGGRVRDLLTGERLAFDAGPAKVPMEAFSARILQLEDP